MDRSLVDELMAELLVRGARPKAEAVDDETVLRFDGCNLYFAVDDTFVSLNERMECGGDVMITDWTLLDGEVPAFAARVVHESWDQFVAECGRR